jgi:hypothetical protein
MDAVGPELSEGRVASTTTPDSTASRLGSRIRAMNALAMSPRSAFG